jgi:hypothetical protein
MYCAVNRQMIVNFYHEDPPQHEHMHANQTIYCGASWWCILQSFNLTLANLDLDGGIVDASGRGKDWGHGTAQIVRSSTAVFLTFGGSESAANF